MERRPMRFRAPRPRQPRDGMALIAALMMLLTAGLMALLVMSYASTANRTAQTRRAAVAAQYLADGALENVRAAIQEDLRLGIEPAPNGTMQVDGESVEYEVTPAAPQTTRPTGDGLTAFVSEYAIETRAREAGAQGRSRRIVMAEVVPIFQFALFYENDLEIWPGPPMTLSGPVRCNSNMYVGCGDSLTFDTNHMRVAGDLFLRRKHSTDVNTEDVRVREFVVDPFDASEPRHFVTLPNKDDLDLLGVGSVSGYDSDFGGLDLDGIGGFLGPGDLLPFGPAMLDMLDEPAGYPVQGNTFLSQEHGVGDVTIPPVEEIAMFVPDDAGGDFDLVGDEFVEVTAGTGTHRKGRFHDQAGLSIITSADGSFVAYDENGSNVTGAVSSAVSVTKLYDARQGGDVVVTAVDVDALNASGVFPKNGLLYTASYGAGTGADVKGTVLTNGAELAGDLTLVSESPVYVQGDYNVVGKKSAAVICDAVNLLSNAWDGTKASGSGVPAASETTYNFAMVSGNVETHWGQYNGGVENLPRFHEDWSGVACNYMGSIVVLWHSEYATEPWGKSGVYSAPRRNWSFDEDFADLADLPPFTPTISLVEDVVSW